MTISCSNPCSSSVSYIEIYRSNAFCHTNGTKMLAGEINDLEDFGDTSSKYLTGWAVLFNKGYTVIQ